MPTFKIADMELSLYMPLSAKFATQHIAMWIED